MSALRELWQFRSLIFNLTSRELKGRYRKSFLGWFWSLLNPASTLAIYTLVFGYFFKSEAPPMADGSKGTYALYLFAALVMWNFFGAIVNGAMGSLLAAGPLMKKIYFPAEAPIVATVLSAVFQTTIESLILVTVLAAFGNVSWTFIYLPVILALLMIFAFGIGLIVAIANVYFRDIAYLVGIGLNLLFFCTPIIYQLKIVPERVGGVIPARALITYNPISQFVAAARESMYLLQAPSLKRMIALVLCAVVSATAGLWIFSFRRRELSEEL